MRANFPGISIFAHSRGKLRRKKKRKRKEKKRETGTPGDRGREGAGVYHQLMQIRARIAGSLVRRFGGEGGVERITRSGGQGQRVLLLFCRPLPFHRLNCACTRGDIGRLIWINWKYVRGVPSRSCVDGHRDRASISRIDFARSRDDRRTRRDAKLCAKLRDVRSAVLQLRFAYKYVIISPGTLNSKEAN